MHMSTGKCLEIKMSNYLITKLLIYLIFLKQPHNDKQAY